MSEWKLFGGDSSPFATREFYADRDAAPHLEQEGHRERILAAVELIDQAVKEGGQTVVDLGAGDGGLLQAIREADIRVPAWGYDLQPANIAAAFARKTSVELVDVLSEPIRWADIAVACEFLEHLVDPHTMVRRIHDAGCNWLIASSPYTETDQAHYDFHLWAWDFDGYRQLLESNGWRVIDVRTAWISQIVLAART